MQLPWLRTADIVRAVLDERRLTTQDRGVESTVLEAPGMPRPRIEAIERGCAATRGERHDIVVALGWLSNNRVAKGRSEAGRQGSRPVGMRTREVF